MITPAPYYNHNTILRNVKPCTPAQATHMQKQTHTMTYEDIASLQEAWAEEDTCFRKFVEARERRKDIERRVVVPL